MLPSLFFIIYLYLFKNWNTSARRWSIITIILGCLVLGLSVTEMHYGGKLNFSSDANSFIMDAMSLCENPISTFSINYSFYKYWLYLSYPCGSFFEIYFMTGLTFIILWSVLVGVAVNEHNQILTTFILKIFLFGFITCGLYLSTIIQRDGLVTVGMILFIYSFFYSNKDKTLLVLSFLLLCVTRVHFAAILGFMLFIIYYLYHCDVLSRLKIPFLVLIAVLIGIVYVVFKTVPVPHINSKFFIITKVLKVNGDSALKSLPMEPDKLYEIYNNGGLEANNLMFSFLVKRFPSIFYEPNPFRYAFWMFLDEEIELSYVNQFLKVFTGLFAGIFLSFWLLTFFINVNKVASMTSGLYIVMVFTFLIIAMMYAIKYFGLPHRIFVTFMASFFFMYMIKPFHSHISVKRLKYVFIAWCFFALLFFFIKPYNYIWYYFAT